MAVLRGSGEPAVEFGVPWRSWATGGPRSRASACNPRCAGPSPAIVADFAPDVVQAHGGEPLKYALAVTRGSGARIVYRRIGTPPRFNGGELRRRAHARLMRRAVRVVAVAEALRSS